MKPFHRITGPQRGFVARRTLTVIALSLAALALLWTVGLGVLLPGWLKARIETEGSAALGAPLSLETLEIRPWALAVGVGGLRLGPADKPWLQVARLEVDGSIGSLLRLAPVVERLTVTEPRLDLRREAPGRYNIQPLLDTLAKRPKPPPDAKPARFSINNIRIERGGAQIVDRVSDSEHRIETVELGIPFVSTLPSHVKIDVEPSLQANVNGSPIRVDGRTQPFDEGMLSTIDIDWREIDLPFWVEAVGPLLPQPLPLALERGKLALQLQLSFERRPPPADPRLHVTGAAAVRDWRSTLTGRGLALGFDELALKGIDVEPLLRRARVAEVAWRGPDIGVDLPQLVAARGSASAAADSAPATPAAQAASAPASAASAPAARGAAPWAWRVDRIAVDEGKGSLRHPAWPQGEQRLGALRLHIDGLDNAADAAPARFEAGASDAHGATLSANGELRAAALQASLGAELAGLDPLPWLAPWRSQLPVELLEARLDAGARLSVDGAARSAELREGRATLLNLRLQPRGERARGEHDRLLLPRLQLTGLEADLAPQQAAALRIERIELERLALKASRGEGGSLAWLDGLKAGRPPVDDTASPPVKAGPKPSLRLAALACNSCSVTLSDRAVAPPATLALERIALKLGNLGTDLAERANFEFSTLAQKNGRVEFGGQLRPQPLELRSKLKVDNLDLRLLQPYLERFLSISVSSARVGAAGVLEIDGNDAEPVGALRWRGRASLSELLTLDELNDRAEFIRFKLLRADGLDLEWKPSQLRADLGRISADDFSARVIINANGTINLREVTKAEAERRKTAAAGATPAAAASAPVVAAAEAASAPGASAARPQLRWQSIELKRGRIDFTDNLIRPNYSAQLSDLAGTVSGVAWNDPQPAQVALTAKVDGSAPLTIDGTLHPLGTRLATDIRAEARGVELTRLSTYAERYAGYGIEKGTLSVKVRYKIEDGKLEAENNLYLDQLTFGSQVESPSALKLPVLLAVALLKDSNGVIDINLPVSGTLDDPQFSIGGIIIKVIVNLITKAVTAPFTLLASAFGSAGEELGYVLFAPGSAELDEAGLKRLETLSKALLARPGLKLEATGRADPATDEAALRERHVDQLMRTQKARAAGQLAESVKIEPDERARWLEAAYKASSFKGKPRNLVGLQKSLPTAEMEALLRENAPVDADALKALADARGNRVKAHLAEQVPAERLLLTASKIGAEGINDKGGAARVSFALK